MISSAAGLLLFGERGAKGNFAEEYAFRSVYIRLCVQQAYNCHRLCLMECYRKIFFAALKAIPVTLLIGFFIKFYITKDGDL